MNRSVVILRATHLHPDPRVEKIGRALVSAGYTVQALGWDREGSLPSEETSAGFPVRRLRLLAPWRSGLRNLPALLRFQFALTRWLDQHRAEYSIIHACDFDTLLPALWAKRRWGKRVVYDIFDFYADMLRRTPGGVVQWVRKAELRGISRADALILADDSRFEQVKGARFARSARRAVIYNAPEDILAELAAQPQPEPKAQLRLAYIGLLQLERGLLPLIAVLHRHPEWHLDLAGSGAEQAQILRAAEGLPNIVFHGQVPYQHALELNHAADVLPAFYDPAIPNHRYASPNKLFEGMMLGKPVLAARGTNVDRIIAQENCGEVLDYGDEAQLEAALLRLADPVYRMRLGQAARHAYEHTYGWQRMAERLTALYLSLEGPA